MARCWQRNFQLRNTARVIHSGGVVAYPTEAVWGLGCDPLDHQAVQRLLVLKDRHWHKGVILIGSDWSHFADYLPKLTTEQQQKLEQSWPGPVTWLVPHNGNVPYWITGNSELVALRMTAHPVAAALCDLVGGAIVSTSANPQGSQPARSAMAVHRYFGDSLDFVAPGRVGGNRTPSQIRNLLTGQVIRPG